MLALLSRLSFARWMLAICTSRSRSSGVGGKSRVQQDVGEQIQAGGEIAAQHFRVHAKTVVAAVAVKAAADGFNLRAISSARAAFRCP